MKLETKKLEFEFENIVLENSKLKNEKQELIELQTKITQQMKFEDEKTLNFSVETFTKLQLELENLENENIVFKNENFDLKKLISDLSMREKKNTDALADLRLDHKRYSELVEEFSSLKIKYLEKINEKIIEKNDVIRKIQLENQRIDLLSRDVERSLSSYLSN